MMNLRMISYLLILISAMSLSVTAFADDCDFDRDGDGAIDVACGGDDCNDYDPDVFPDAAERCDVLDKDEDCNPNTYGERDADGDGFNDANCANQDLDGTYIRGSDCNDGNRSVHPIATEVCNGIDDNCDGAIDNENSRVPQYVDYDLDGYGDPNEGPMGVCAGTAGFSMLSNDCDDSNPAIAPGDQICIEGAPEAILVCSSDGQWLPSTCPVDQQCVTQNNGAGFCVDMKAVSKKK